ncbi:MAG TPA: YHS domain-containing protein [Pirellulales bacterium]|nr:YHS domain-containing protein [Pirellulales bacterium]
MDLLEDFSRRIEAQLAAARKLPIRSSASFEESMARFASRLQEFEALALHIMADIVRPRMERLAAFFPGATLSKPSDHYHCTCWFGASDHSSSMAVLELGIDHDERLERAELIYELKVVPAFLPYERHDKLVLDLVPARVDVAWRSAGVAQRVDEQSVVAWVEGRLLGFVETYLRLQACGTPPQGDTGVDPVCGMRIRKAEAKGVQEYKGHRYYFCSEKCGQLFTATPENFAKVVVALGG